MDKRIKVVLLSQYWSDEMAELVGRKHYFRELAPWIQETINLFKGKDDLELHIVAPNYASNTDVNVKKDNLHYHFYHYAPTWFSNMMEPLIKQMFNHAEPYKLAERLGNVLSAYSVPTQNAIRIINSINPDLIHLFGSEAPDYSKAALKLLDKYPVLLTVQGYGYLLEDTGNIFEKIFHWYMARYEAKINKKVKYRTVSRPMTKEEAIIPEKHFFEQCEKLYFLTSITKIPQIDASQQEKNYDAVFYARIVKDKGIEDLIGALSLLRQKGLNLRTAIIGKGNDSYINHIKNMAHDNDIENIFDYIGFVENHEEVYKIASQARMMVLPTYRDGINNTIREAMFMKLPIVANSVDALAHVNDRRHCVHLLTPGDIDALAEGMCKVLDDELYRNELIDNSYKEAWEVYSPDAVYGQMIGAYKDLLEYVNSNCTTH